MSGALIRENESIQKRGYYFSMSLTGAQTSYQRMEKLALALFITSRKLRYYFHSFPITVLMEHPLQGIIENSEATGRIAK